MQIHGSAIRVLGEVYAGASTEHETFGPPIGHGAIVGESGPLRRALDQLERVAATDSTVLLLGETGTGKELFASQIHELSARRAGRWCA